VIVVSRPPDSHLEDRTDMSHPPTESLRPSLAAERDVNAATAVVARFVADLQEGWDRSDATIADRRLAADVAWGSPYGATVDNYDTLLAIHQRLKKQGAGGRQSRYEINRVLPVSEDVIVAQVARLALDEDGRALEPNAQTDGAFSEMALYVLVRRDDNWWLAAGQNTPIRPGGAI
jgi:hypothetical protein